MKNKKTKAIDWAYRYKILEDFRSFKRKSQFLKDISLHKTKKIRIGKKIIEVDVELAEVIKALNKVGLKTVGSCQGVFLKNSFFI